MKLRHSVIAVAVIALAFASGNAHAQSTSAKHRNDARVVPILNKTSGKLEAVLLLEPTAVSAGTRWRFGKSTLETTFGLQSGDSLALLCDRQEGLSAAIGKLASNCVTAVLDNDKGSSRHVSAGASLSRNGNKLGVTIGNGHGSMPTWLAPGQMPAKVESNDFSLLAEKTFGREGYVSVGGTVARARLVPAADVPQLADQWNTRSLNIAGGFGAFSANVVGRVVSVPGESSVWQGLGLGVTWRTPWNGQLSVGADNVVTRGKNPFSLKGDQDDGAMPYVRYQQDL